jgi:hypothetical protein
MVKDKIDEMELKKSRVLDAMSIAPYFFGGAVEGVATNQVSAPTESDATGTQTMDDRNIKVSISRDDNGCQWAYENETSVSSCVNRVDNLINTGFDVFISDPDKKNELEKAKKLIEERILILPDKISSSTKNKFIFGWSVLKKIKKSNGDIIGLLELDPKECKAIRDLSTGELGGIIGKGINPNNKDMEVAVVQEGNTPKYDQYGTVSYDTTYFYFTKDDIIVFNNSDRGKFIGTSPVKRVLRLIEIKKSIENTIELVIRRFGPQIMAVVGNADVNLTNSDIPESYLRDSDGNPVARSTARTSFKNDVFSNIETKIQDWANADTLVQIMEYGVDLKTLNPSSNLMDYSKYINLFANYIRFGLLDITPQGRIDVTSAMMQETVDKAMKDLASKERIKYEITLNKEYVNPILKANGFKEGDIIIKFKPLDKIDERRQVEIERLKSETIFNYFRSGIPVPKRLADDWEIENIDMAKTQEQIKKEEDEKAKKEKEEGKEGPASKNKEDMEKGR